LIIFKKSGLDLGLEKVVLVLPVLVLKGLGVSLEKVNGLGLVT